MYNFEKVFYIINKIYKLNYHYNPNAVRLVFIQDI
jgi:hypothetical protein